MNQLPRRKNVRLQNYDYSSNGIYFLTFCTEERRNLFADVAGIHFDDSNLFVYPKIELNAYGKIVSEIIEALPARFPICLDGFIVMPNHVHLLVGIDSEKGSAEQKRSQIAKIVGYIKMNSSKQIHEMNPNLKVWQRSFYDHVVRDEAEYLKIAEYIQTNSLKWHLDRYYVE